MVGMSTAAEIHEARAVSVRVTDEELIVALEDGRTLSVPISWYPRLSYGSLDERADVRLVGNGIGIHWPQLDEDISIEGMLAGHKPGESAASLKRWKATLDNRRRSSSPDPWKESLPLPAWWDKE